MAVPASIVRPEADDMLVPRAEVAELPHNGLGLRVLVVERLYGAGAQLAALAIDECLCFSNCFSNFWLNFGRL